MNILKPLFILSGLALCFMALVFIDAMPVTMTVTALVGAGHAITACYCEYES